MARRIDTEAEIDWIRVADQVGDPASPAAGYKYFYAKSGGLYLVNSAGTVVGPLKTVATDTIWDAAGDMVYATGADAASKLGIGTAYQLLRTNSGATAPEWVSAGRVLISQQTPTGTGTVTWDSIPATWNSLEIEYVARSTQAAISVSLYCYFNNDTTATNYRKTLIYGYATNTLVTTGADNAEMALIAAGNSIAGSCGSGRIEVCDYKSTAFRKLTRCLAGLRYDATAQEGTMICSSEWENTNAITRVDLITSAGNYDTGSTFRLYGVF